MPLKALFPISKANQIAQALSIASAGKRWKKLLRILNVNGIKALPYHAGLDAKTARRIRINS
jgi:superfamily II helicase